MQFFALAGRGIGDRPGQAIRVAKKLVSDTDFPQDNLAVVLERLER
jgi:hypothetical protein